MNDQVLCEKCGNAMVPIDSNIPIGMTCPNCGWGWATTYSDPIIDDETVYTITLVEGNSASTDTLRILSNTLSVNFLAAKKLIETAPCEVLSDRAQKIKEVRDLFKAQSILIKITPDFPY